MDPNFYGGYGFGGFAGPFPGARGGRFEAIYKCFPVAFIRRDELEGGGKIILPPSALDRLTQLNVQYPMLFELCNQKQPNQKLHAGVLEFIAEEGYCYLPYWMMQNLLIPEDISVKSATLPLGTFVKLQPHSKTFLDISNPKAVLERALRGFSALSKNEEICIPYNNKNYYLTVLEAEPVHPSGGINIVEADVRVDFAPPRDYKEPVRPAPSASIPVATPSASGGGLVFGSSPVAKQQGVASAGSTPPSKPSAVPAAAPPAEEEKKFQAFTGGGYRLDGKPAAAPSSSSSSSSSSTPAPATATAKPAAVAKPAAAPLAKPASGILFGPAGAKPSAPSANPSAAAKPAAAKAEAKPAAEPEKTFKPFQGTGYSLKG